jgi:hypothetical protein
LEAETHNDVVAVHVDLYRVMSLADVAVRIERVAAT